MKNFLRQEWLIKRFSISNERRKTTSHNIVEVVLPIIKCHKNILSFCSFRGEIDTEVLNQKLIELDALVLPFIFGENLQLYRVRDLFKETKKNAFGIREPIPEKTEPIPTSAVTLGFIPGLAFDKNHHRLGYGKGFYDRLLDNHSMEAIGIGFTEQLSPIPLPFKDHDIRLDRIILV